MLSERNHEQKSTWSNSRYKTGKTDLQSYKSQKYWQWREKDERGLRGAGSSQFRDLSTSEQGWVQFRKIHLSEHLCAFSCMKLHFNKRVFLESTYHLHLKTCRLNLNTRNKYGIKDILKTSGLHSCKICHEEEKHLKRPRKHNSHIINTP